MSTVHTISFTRRPVQMKRSLATHREWISSEIHQVSDLVEIGPGVPRVRKYWVKFERKLL